MIPFYIVGDGWGVPSGLGRIARDLSGVLGVAHIGYHPPALIVGGLGQQFSFSHLGDDWGAGTVVRYLAEHYDGLTPGVLLVVWDPSRAFAYLGPMRQYLPEWQLWGYFAVDGVNINGTLGGPLAEAVKHFDWVTAYTKYGAMVLREIRGKPVPYLPHGISVPRAEQDPELLLGTRQRLIPRLTEQDRLIGCVATNQFRKDLHLFIGTISELRDRGVRAWGWLHTDDLVQYWSIPELLKVHRVERNIRVTTGVMSDQELWRYYAACHATICVGRGEGFGYPIVESLACGTPVLGMDYAGGAELLPRPWRYQWGGIDYANPYAIGRPLGQINDVCDRILRILEQDRSVLAPYCRGAVEHLQWDYLRPRWQAWMKKGVEQL